MTRLVTLAAVAFLALACTCNDSSGSADVEASSSSSAAQEAPDGGSANLPRAFDLVKNVGSCEITHRGLSIDLGTPSVGPRRGFTVASGEEVQVVDRGGASFERVRAKRLKLDFWLDEEQPEGVRVSVRVHGAAARRMTGYVDGKRIGTAKLNRGETTVVTLPSVRFKLAQGRHTLMLRFWKSTRAAREAFAELDWIRIGAEDDSAATYAAPTLGDVVRDFELGGQPKRSIVLRAASSLRCSMQPARNAELKMSLGFWGSGRGDVEVRVVQDGEPPVTMQQRKLSGGSDAKWIPLRIDLSAYAGQLIGLELRVLHAAGGGRVAFGDPVVTYQKASEVRVPRARVAVLVVAAGLDRRRVPPWGPIGELAALGQLARIGTAFSQYRVPTTVPAGVFASLLTGLAPRSHTVEDQAARLPRVVRTVGKIVKEASGRTAFFTGVPTTFAAFGFDTGWDRFAMFSPVKDLPATDPYEHAARWLEQELEDAEPSRLLLVVHARGAHPPWDLTKEEVSRLPPEEYGGVLDARRGGIVLGKRRARRRGGRNKLAEEDWVRLRALQDAAMLKQDAGLLELMNVLKRKGAWEQTLFIFAGDVAAGDPPALPYDPAGPLAENRLLVPLLVKFPGQRSAVKESNVPSRSEDIAYTILRALRLDVPRQVNGVDLFRSASGLQLPAGRVQVATLGPSYASRLGTWLLAGEFGKVPKLCRLDVDPACVSNVWDENPIAAQVTWRWTYEAELRARSAPHRIAEREPASIDPETAAALTVWGDVVH